MVILLTIQNRTLGYFARIVMRKQVLIKLVTKVTEDIIANFVITKASLSRLIWLR